ncbi:hypothetical protein SAY86_010860 [Trapa natans]|uniref:Uncharacterized protein n=1 Tax=Trapa natans TaxID=22666 RepID=A0AAN7LW32_TRANT|nr:hypothetical protein SAY86_010860 [Trapa natans]
MDPSIRLDYALFQLTPTRTRCDLVIFRGGKTEKLAHGLLDPFLSHLKFAKDEISKGGYSITLRPPSSDDASWFTKATFERFVRFVSTPEILERFITLEKEISQIESSVQANELEKAHVPRPGEQGSPTASNVNSVKSSDSSKGEPAESEDSVQEEHSRIRLQRLLETRRATLLRSQAMAYARARAAGFEMDNMDDLIAFSDTFGASRMREACTEFKELCKKKQSDIPWMEELSAMEAYSSTELTFPATSGIILANEINYPASNNDLLPNGFPDVSKQEPTTIAGSEGKKDDNIAANNIQMQIPWLNQFAPYMYPMHQIPPYHGYPFPVMPPHGPNDPRWAFSSEGAHQDLKGEAKFMSKSLKKEHNFQKEAEDEDSEEDSQSASSESEGEKKHSPTEHSQRKKHRKKKSSKMVVIRNINYIASKEEENEDGDSHDSTSSPESEFSLKKKIEEAVGVFKKNHKSKRHTRKKSDGSNHMTEHEEETEATGAHVEKTANENWDAFQNLLMKEEKEPDLTPQGQLEHSQDNHFVRSFGEELSDGPQKVMTQRKIRDDSLAMTDRTARDDPNEKSIDFGNGENTRSVLRRREFADDAMLLSGSLEKYENLHNPLPDSNFDSSLIKNRRSSDGFIINQTLKLDSGDVNVKEVTFDGDYLDMGKSRKDPQVDDSFMIHDRSSVDDSRDISMGLEYMSASQMKNAFNAEPSGNEHKEPSTHEPVDLCVVLERDNDVGSNRLSWTSGYEVDFSLAEVEKSPAKEVTAITPDSSDGKTNSGKKKELSAGKDARSKVVNRSPVGKIKPEAVSRVKKPTLMNRTATQKSKFEKEEELRQRMEASLLERQRRIAERTAASGITTPTKRSPVERTAKTATRTERAKPQSRVMRV